MARPIRITGSNEGIWRNVAIWGLSRAMTISSMVPRRQRLINPVRSNDAMPAVSRWAANVATDLANSRDRVDRGSETMR